jgi:mediator of RNA polymerase II transcription subunit 7
VEQPFPPGIERLYNPEPGSDPRPHLRQLLISLLSAYHKLLSGILEPVPSGYHRPPSPTTDPSEVKQEDPEWPPPLNWEATVLWIRTLVLNLGWAVNEFRPVQARMTLEAMMRRQIEIRKEETKAIHTLVTKSPYSKNRSSYIFDRKCDELEKTLADLRSKTAALLPVRIQSLP